MGDSSIYDGSRGGWVKKYLKFADKQFIKLGLRGEGGSKNPKPPKVKHIIASSSMNGNSGDASSPLTSSCFVFVRGG